MALVINSNLASLATQRALTETQKDSSVSLERLSSGLRINSAQDDAAGMAISSRFTAQINGLSAAMRNANDGVSMLQTAEGAMQEVTSNLQRMRELAVQSANGTNGTTDKDALHTELSALVSEINRIATATSFNGNSIFDGAVGTRTAAIQVGADSTASSTTNSITIGTNSFIDARSQTLGTTGATSANASVTYLAGTDTTSTGVDTAGDVTVNGTDIGTVATGGNSGNYAQALANAFETADSNITATVGASTLSMAGGANVGLGTWTDTAVAAYSLSVNGNAVITTETVVTAAEVDLGLAAIADELAAGGITYTGTVAGGDLAFTSASGKNIVISETLAAGMTGGFQHTNAAAGGGATTTVGYGTVTLESDYNIAIAGNDTQQLDADLTTGDTALVTGQSAGSGTALSSISISSTGDAQAALTSIDNALNAVNTARAEIGAEMSRLDSVSSNLSSTIENYTAARSRVQDADFAVESANLARTQVLQQAGISVLAQANALPQQVLALLQ
jgi:flagellin